MGLRQYPATGRKHILKVLDDAGYVEIEEFAHLGEGYFCRTCTKMSDVVVKVDEPNGFIGYLCKGLKVPVSPHGCCNYWVYNPPRFRGGP